MTNELLKESTAIILGKQASEISQIIYGKKPVNEFTIAKKMEITINQTRNLLYKLSDYNLVRWIRKKDKRKGWYTYFWKMDSVRTLEFLKDRLESRLTHLQNQIQSREANQYYICETCNIEFNEQDALFNNFTCDECENLLSEKDNTKILRGLKRHTSKISEKIGVVKKELEKEKERVENEREKTIIRQESAKKAARTKAKNKSSDVKKTSGKKPTKKTSNKKTGKNKSSAVKKTSGKKTGKKPTKKTSNKKNGKNKSAAVKKTSGKKTGKKPTKKTSNKKNGKNKSAAVKKTSGKKTGKKPTKKTSNKKNGKKKK